MNYRFIALGICGLLLAPPGFAEEKPAEEKPAEAKPATTSKPSATDKAKRDQEEYGPWKVKVPGEFRGYSLRISGDVVPLDHDEITLKGSDSKDKVELLDPTGRMMSEDTVFVDPYVFDFVDSRHWRFDLYFGSASINGTGMRTLLQDSQLSENSLDIEYQPGPIGVLVSFSTNHSSQDQDLDITSTYDQDQTRIAASYEWIPIPRGSFFRQVHALTYAGIVLASDRIKIADDTVKLEDKSDSTGGIIGTDFLYPIHHFWIGVRVYMSYHEIKFKKFDFDEKAVQHGALIGGGYAL